MRLVTEEDHFSPNRGEAAVWGKVVRRRSESNARERRSQRLAIEGVSLGREASEADHEIARSCERSE